MATNGQLTHEDFNKTQNHNQIIAFTQSGLTMYSLATAGPAYQAGVSRGH